MAVPIMVERSLVGGQGRFPGGRGYRPSDLVLLQAKCLWILDQGSGNQRQRAYVAGIPVTKLILAVMFVSGGLAGLSGLSEVAGVKHVLSDGIGVNYGFYGVSAALLGRMKPLPVLFVAIGMGALLTGGLAVERLQVSRRPWSWSSLPAFLSACFSSHPSNVVLSEAFAALRVRPLDRPSPRNGDQRRRRGVTRPWVGGSYQLF